MLTDISVPIEQIPGQQGTDLEYIRFLAEEAGYVFYLDPGPAPGMTRAYWGPQIKVGAVQPALSTDMDAYTNVESMHFKFDQEQNRIPLVYIYNQETGVTIPIPIPPVTPLNPPLGLIPPLPTNIMADLKPFRDDLSKTAHSPGHHDGARRGREILRGRDLPGQPRRDALRRCAAVLASSSACAAPAPPSTGSTTSRA